MNLIQTETEKLVWILHRILYEQVSEQQNKATKYNPRRSSRIIKPFHVINLSAVTTWLTSLNPFGTVEIGTEAAEAL